MPWYYRDNLTYKGMANKAIQSVYTDSEQTEINDFIEKKKENDVTFSTSPTMLQKVALLKLVRE